MVNTQEMAENNCIYKIRSGSHLYGTNTEASDLDFMGIFVPDKDYVLGVYKVEQVITNEKVSQGTKNSKEDVDCVTFSLPKFIQLASNNNPNIIEMFFANHTATVLCADLGRILKENYKLFVSKECYHRFRGFSYSQKMKLLSDTGKGRDVTRNELVEKFGYDTKYSAHLIRLLLEGIELLVEGKLTMPLTQNVLIRDIRVGKFTKDEVLKKAEDLEKLLDLAYVNSSLQGVSDSKSVNALQIFLLEEFWKGGN